jgi:hypothetical protein
MTRANRNRLMIGATMLFAAGFIAAKMFFSLTPPTHADHDHAMASLDAGGFLWIRSIDGDRRNLVGQPGHVLVLHWFDPDAPDSAEQSAAAEIAAGYADDTGVDFAFIARASSAEGLDSWAQETGVDPSQLYFDRDGKTADLCGVRRWPETLIYDPKGTLAFQAKGAMDWNAASVEAQIRRAAGGVEEMH